MPEAGPSVNYTSISSFGWDQDSYGTDPNFVYVYVMSGVDGVGEVKDRVTCDFTSSSFDLKIGGLNGKHLRLLKKGLEKEILPAESKVIVKKNRVTIKMKKAKGQCTRAAPKNPRPSAADAAPLPAARCRSCV